MKRANSGMTWIQQPHVTAFLQQLAATPVITHARLDELPASRTREYVRGLLVEHNALPRRDELSARFSEWSVQALERITSQKNRDIIRRYIRWHHQRRMNQMGEVTQGTFLRAKQSVTVAIELLNWLTERDTELGEVTQAHLDRWQAEGPTTRGIASRFLDWATRTSLIDPSLKLQPHRRGTSPRLDAAAQAELVHNLSHTTDMNPRDRAAAILVLVFGQQVSDIVQLTWDDVRPECCTELVDYSGRNEGLVLVPVGALSPHIGYEKATLLAQEALNTGKGIPELAIAENLLGVDQIKALLLPDALTRGPGRPV